MTDPGYRYSLSRLDGLFTDEMFNSTPPVDPEDGLFDKIKRRLQECVNLLLTEIGVTEFNMSVLSEDYSLFEYDFNAIVQLGERTGTDWIHYMWFAPKDDPHRIMGMAGVWREKSSFRIGFKVYETIE